MVEKRVKGISYLDSIDLEILEYLDNANFEEDDLVGYSVLDIVDHLKIKHNNLKPHLDKLLSLKLITILEKPIRNKDNKAELDSKGVLKTKIVIANIKRGNLFWMNNVYMQLNPEEEELYSECKVENKRFEEVLKLLQTIRSYYYDKEKLKKVDFDLRKNATQQRLLNLQIGTLSKKSNDLIIKKKKEIQKIKDNSKK